MLRTSLYSLLGASRAISSYSGRILSRPFLLSFSSCPSSAHFHHAHFASPTLHRSFVGNSSSEPDPGDPLTPSELASHPSTKKLIDWSLASKRTGDRSVEIIKRRALADDNDGEWVVEVYLQDLAAKEGTDLKEGQLIAKAVNEHKDDALTEAAEEALDLLKLAEKTDY
ncbi:hypothetical protein JCM8547_006702 [Rhodosporidiobolus lusitaniae]